jgi:Glycine cleavage H-protein
MPRARGQIRSPSARPPARCRPSTSRHRASQARPACSGMPPSGWCAGQRNGRSATCHNTTRRARPETNGRPHPAGRAGGTSARRNNARNTCQPEIQHRSPVGPPRRRHQPVRAGVTDFAQQSLGDVVEVTPPGAGDTITAGEACGDIESVKSVSDLSPPSPGRSAPATTTSPARQSSSTPTPTARAGCSRPRPTRLRWAGNSQP